MPRMRNGGPGASRGGLAQSGLPDAAALAAVADVGDTPDRVRYLAGGCGDEASDGVELTAWAQDAVELRVPIPDDGDGTKARCWVYARQRAGADVATGAGEVTWLGGSTQTLDEHGRRVGEAIRSGQRQLFLSANPIVVNQYRRYTKKVKNLLFISVSRESIGFS